MRRALVAAALLLATFAAARPARASLEQFQGFDVFAPEDDDENAIDYFLARPLDDWRADWEGATGGVRSDQGCMTAGVWYQDNTFKARAPMGDHTWLDTEFLQHTDPGGSYQWVQFDVLRRTRWGAFGGRFRPAYEKSQHDFAALWQLGDGRAPLQVRATLSAEDAFNELWTFRQSQVGEVRRQPYHVHPFEPSLDVVSRGPRHRLELSATWLTPMRQEIIDPDSLVAGTRTLRGGQLLALAERTVGAWTGIARAELVSARSTQANLVQAGDGRVDRERWSGEVAVRRRLGPRWRAEGRYIYMRRAEDWRPPVDAASFGALDRIGHAGLVWDRSERWQGLLGLLYDRVSVGWSGNPPGFSYGTRKESRAYFGFQALIGRVRVQAVEGIELDSEPYQVTFHHDKGFLHAQTTF